MNKTKTFGIATAIILAATMVYAITTITMNSTVNAKITGPNTATIGQQTSYTITADLTGYPQMGYGYKRTCIVSFSNTGDLPILTIENRIENCSTNTLNKVYTYTPKKKGTIQVTLLAADGTNNNPTQIVLVRTFLAKTVVS
jgi:hypothetical protein